MQWPPADIAPLNMAWMEAISISAMLRSSSLEGSASSFITGGQEKDKSDTLS